LAAERVLEVAQGPWGGSSKVDTPASLILLSGSISPVLILRKLPMADTLTVVE
jgi:hypothetical protein